MLKKATIEQRRRIAVHGYALYRYFSMLIDLGFFQHFMGERKPPDLKGYFRQAAKQETSESPVVFELLGAEAIDGAEVRLLSAGNPHEHDVLANSLGDLARGVDSLGVGVENDLGKHFGVIAVPAAARVSDGEDRVVQTIDGFVDDANEMIGRDVFLEIHWQAK